MRIIIGCLSMAVLATGAVAQDAPAPLRSVLDCRSIDDRDRRLACFDAAVGKLDAAVAAREVTVLDRESVRKTRRSLFGFTLPSLGVFGAKDDEPDTPEFQELNTKITRVIPAGFQRYELVIEEGGRWVTSDPAPRPPREGAAIRIRRGALGSYVLSIAGQRGIRGRRIG